MATPSEAQRRQYHKEWTEKNRDKVNATQARFRERNRERLNAVSLQRLHAKKAACGPEELLALKRKHADAKLLSYQRCKDSVYKAYGGYVCKCCDITEPMFLSIDHVNDDGAHQRKNVHGKTPAALYAFLRKNKFPQGYQILCMNCQVGKHRNGGVCPHKSGNV